MNLNEYIDHTNLKSSATRFDIEKLCTEAAYWKSDICSVGKRSFKRNGCKGVHRYRIPFGSEFCKN